MRITEIDLEIEDLEWYAIDNKGRIAFLTSGGSKMVPEFVCRSKEELKKVADYFECLTSNYSEHVEVSHEASKYPQKEFIEECKKISNKGLYCYDIEDEMDYESEYICICKPLNELSLNDLPDDIQRIMKDWKIGNQLFGFNKGILVSKAYD